MKDEEPAFDFSNFNLEDTILAAAFCTGELKFRMRK